MLLGLVREGEGVAAQVLRASVPTCPGSASRSSSCSRATRAASRVDAAGGARRPEQSPGSSPVLDQFGRNLTQLAREHKLDPVIGRET